MTMELMKQVISNCLPSSKSVQESIGLKLTEIGLVPEDWPLSTFGSICSAIGDGIHSTPIFNSNGEYYFVNGNNLVHGRVTLSDDTKKADNVEFNKHQKPLGDRTILISINGTIGNIAIYRSEKIILGKSAAYLNIKSNVDKGYIFHCLNSDATQKAFNNGLTGSTIKNLGLGTIRNTVLPLPPIQEQTAIANALSDVDALIQELEKLIAKKQAIKTATMQQLLTGRTRLPPFGFEKSAHHPDGRKKGYKPSELGEIPEDWEIVSIGDTLSIRHGKNQKAVENPSGAIPIFATGGQIGWADQSLWEKPSVLIGRKGTIDKPRFAEEPFWTVDTLFYSEIKNCADAKFIFYKFCMIDWMQYNEASGVPSLNASTIERVLTSLPVKEEQLAIALVLSAVDEEINALEQRLNKTRQIKQGMMQELLTGKTRLVKPAGAA
ncbi:TPA: restriction endonuclease subunit S [Vibrio cholerae]|nr:restriction endonuclease subunit S [Vibrio cholerae]